MSSSAPCSQTPQPTTRITGWIPAYPETMLGTKARERRQDGFPTTPRVFARD